MSGTLSLVALVVISVLMIGWFAVLWRDERIGRDAAERLFNEPEMSDSEFARALDELQQAELLNPGEEWATLRAAALILRDKPAAVRVAESVVRREPENLNAWVAMLNATRGRDALRSAQAIAQIRRLSPPLPSR